MTPGANPPAPGGGGVFAMQRSALIGAAGVAPDVEDAIRRGLRPLGDEGGRAVAGIQGFATAATLTSITGGWQRALGALAGQVGDFGPRLKQSARTVEAAEREATGRVSMLPGVKR
jgi:hypothetical protein